jgi:putative phosphoribosyl transferase
MLFNDRYDAAIKLIPRLEKYRKERGVVLAVPRGGVPLGYYIAKNFNLPLELLMTKKIGHPLSSELAIGSVSMENHSVDEEHEIADEYLHNEIKRIQQSLKERYKKFMGERTPADLQGKIVIITDDGVATGNTILSAIKTMKPKHPKKIVVAVPVAPVETADRIKKEVDDFICLHVAEHFFGVSQFYRDFSQVSDDEVITLLKEANRFGTAA